MEWVQTEEDYEPEKNTHLELETEDLRNKKANIRRNSAKQSNNMTQQLQGNCPSFHHLSSLPLCLSSPVISLSLWDQDYSSPLTLSQQLWDSLLSKLLLILTPRPTLTPLLLLSWTNLDFTLWEEGHPSISCVLMDREQEEEGRGEESIWLVNFNRKADVSVYL